MAREAIEVLKECEAFLEGHFLLTSGRHSDRYLQCAKVFQDAHLKDDALTILYQICHTNYGLRGAVNVYINTAAYFSGDVNAGTLARMMREMNIGR